MSTPRFPPLHSVLQPPVELDLFSLLQALGPAAGPSAWAPEMRHGFGEPGEPVWPELITDALVTPPAEPDYGFARLLPGALIPDSLASLASDPPPMGLIGNRLLGNALTQRAFGPAVGDSARWPELPQEKARREARSRWNGSFAIWEKNVSLSEEGMLDRASQMVQAAIRGNTWLTQAGARIEPQGSWYNATNIRKDSDVDLRVMLPMTWVDYDPGVYIGPQHFAQAYVQATWTHKQLFARARLELAACLEARFGKANVTPGGKAFAVAGVLGSRAKVDVVPAVPYHYVWADTAGQLHTIVGVAILGTNDLWTYNYPAQHHANGVAKRNSTSRQFKRVSSGASSPCSQSCSSTPPRASLRWLRSMATVKLARSASSVRAATMNSMLAANHRS
jgi:hypothetical protein